MRMLSITTTANVPDEAIVCHDVRNPVDRNEVLARKGSRLDAASVTTLLEAGVDELHLAVPEAGDVAEDEAAFRLASAIVGPRVTAEAAHFGQASLVAETRGVL